MAWLIIKMSLKNRIISVLRFTSLQHYNITTSYGAVKAFRVKSTNIDDRDLSLKLKIDSIILGDNGYVSESLVEKLNQQEQELLALKHKNSCEKYPPIFQEEIFRSVNALKRLFLT